MYRYMYQHCTVRTRSRLLPSHIPDRAAAHYRDTGVAMKESHYACTVGLNWYDYDIAQESFIIVIVSHAE